MELKEKLTKFAEEKWQEGGNVRFGDLNQYVHWELIKNAVASNSFCCLPYYPFQNNFYTAAEPFKLTHGKVNRE